MVRGSGDVSWKPSKPVIRSSAINLEDIGRVHFRLPTSENGQQVRLMRADVKIDGPTIFVFLDEATEGWPFKIENDSEYAFSFSQTVRILRRNMLAIDTSFPGSESCECRARSEAYAYLHRPAEVES